MPLPLFAFAVFQWFAHPPFFSRHAAAYKRKGCENARKQRLVHIVINFAAAGKRLGINNKEKPVFVRFLTPKFIYGFFSEPLL
jgi:hypothetical protein